MTFEQWWHDYMADANEAANEHEERAARAAWEAALSSLRPEAGLTEAEKDLMLLWCEWTGGHINAQEFAVAINDRIMDNLLVKQASAPRPQHGEQPKEKT